MMLWLGYVEDEVWAVVLLAVTAVLVQRMHLAQQLSAELQPAIVSGTKQVLPRYWAMLVGQDPPLPV